jgi:hypothetical protein
MSEPDQARKIYLDCMSKVKSRLAFAEAQLRLHEGNSDIYYLENAILHLRKTLENIAFAAVAPNRKAFAELRAKAEKSPDYRNDYNGSKILLSLSKINKDFYPIPLENRTSTAPGNYHFERAEDGFITKKQFARTYDRLGKFLHADNPKASKLAAYC